MYKLILFDLGGVLFTNGTKKFVADLSARYGLPLESLKIVLDDGIGSQYREGQITRDEFWKLAIDQLGLTESPDKLEAEWIENYELIPGTKEIIIGPAKKFKVMYLSDNVRERSEKLDHKFGFMNWFSGGIFSHEVGVRKPNPKIYEFALARGEAAASETIFIDDKSQMLEPAHEMGITTLLFTSPEKLSSDLKDLEVM